MRMREMSKSAYTMFIKSIPNRVAGWDFNQVNKRSLLKRAEGWLFNLRGDGLRGYLKVYYVDSPRYVRWFEIKVKKGMPRHDIFRSFQSIFSMMFQ